MKPDACLLPYAGMVRYFTLTKSMIAAGVKFTPAYLSQWDMAWAPRDV